MKNKLSKTQGFTLIEILIALVVFAIIAGFTSSILSQILQFKDNSKEQINKINNLQLAVSLLTKDVRQIVERPTRGNQMHAFPSFIGQDDYLEFTRGGYANPSASEKRSTLMRIAYLCKDNNLVRRVWAELDTPDRDTYQDTIMLNSLKKCEFAYIGMHHNMMPNWYQYTITRGEKSITTPLPVCIQLTINQEKVGFVKLRFQL